METTTNTATTPVTTEVIDLTAEECTCHYCESLETTVPNSMEYEFKLTPQELGTTAPIMGKGMLGIFVVMGIIILCVSALNHFGSPDRKKKREEKKAAKAQAKNNNNQ
ncbi:MAG: hypothetical protein U0L11_06950 [Acutalibacteraceae bacterium]|nr:hypothetical protein [Acutalibacteraceae bacterium]